MYIGWRLQFQWSSWKKIDEKCRVMFGRWKNGQCQCRDNPVKVFVPKFVFFCRVTEKNWHQNLCFFAAWLKNGLRTVSLPSECYYITYRSLKNFAGFDKLLNFKSLIFYNLSIFQFREIVPLKLVFRWSDGKQFMKQNFISSKFETKIKLNSSNLFRPVTTLVCP
jgi:hypothetical protein